MLDRYIAVSGDSRHAHLEKNLYGGRRKAHGLDGLSGSSDLPKWTIPASLYLKEKPPFWGDRPWPAIGADVDLRALHTGNGLTPTPAQERLERVFPSSE
jgi:hypothetical protein